MGIGKLTLTLDVEPDTPLEKAVTDYLLAQEVTAPSKTPSRGRKASKTATQEEKTTPSRGGRGRGRPKATVEEAPSKGGRRGRGRPKATVEETTPVRGRGGRGASAKTEETTPRRGRGRGRAKAEPAKEETQGVGTKAVEEWVENTFSNLLMEAYEAEHGEGTFDDLSDEKYSDLLYDELDAFSDGDYQTQESATPKEFAAWCKVVEDAMDSRIAEFEESEDEE